MVGGGISGASIFWEAALRGVSVALLEQNDFASAAAAYNLEIGAGLRYLQQADFRRLRVTTRERTTLMRIAPNLVHPLPIIMPLYRNDAPGHVLLGLATSIGNLVTHDRNHSLDPQKVTPNGRLLSKRECLELLPGISPQGLTGGVLFYDAQIYNWSRLVLAFLKSAAQIGGDLANYAKVVDFICEKRRVVGVKALDQITGQYFEVFARMIIVCAGAGTPELLERFSSPGEAKSSRLIRKLTVVTRPVFRDYAVGFHNPERKHHFYFVSPWRERSVIGTYETPQGDTSEAVVTDGREIDGLLQQINRTWVPAYLTRDDVRAVHSALVLSSDTVGQDRPVKTGDQNCITDHRQNKVEGIMSVTMGQVATVRRVAAHVLDQVFAAWGHRLVDSVSDTTPLRGGEMQGFSEFQQRELAANRWQLSESTLRQLTCNYGSDYTGVLDHLPPARFGLTLSEERRAVLEAEIYHAVHKEMALKLTDIVFRRTELASAERPDSETLTFCAQILGKVLGWDNWRVQREIDEVLATFAWKG